MEHEMCGENNPVSSFTFSAKMVGSDTMGTLAENHGSFPSTSSTKSVEVLVKVPGSIVHQIVKEQSVELASGDFEILRVRKNGSAVAVIARVGEEIQWPLAKDQAVVKLDDSHYFFTLKGPGSRSSDDEYEIVAASDDQRPTNYGLAIASKGQESQLGVLDGVLEHYSNFVVRMVDAGEGSSSSSSSSTPWAADGAVARMLSPVDTAWSEEMRGLMGEESAAYWTTLAPNVEDYSGSVARLIATGSAQLIRGILWGSDAAVARLMLGTELLKERIGPSSNIKISPKTIERIERVKRFTKMSENVANGVLSGVVEVSERITSSLVNSKIGKKLVSRLPGEIFLASLDGFCKTFDAIEIAGKQTLSTTSIMTTGLISQRFGEEAAQATNEGFDAAGHAIGTAWVFLRIQKALIEPTAKAFAQVNSPDMDTTYSEPL